MLRGESMPLKLIDQDTKAVCTISRIVSKARLIEWAAGCLSPQNCLLLISHDRI